MPGVTMLRRCGVVLITGCLLALPLPAHAQEVSLTVGRFLGDDIAEARDGLGGLLSFGNAGLYGVRVGIGFVLVDLEASGLIGSTSLFDQTPFEIDARFRYIEGSALLRLLPGPVAPFVAAGIGFHRLNVDVLEGIDYDTIGYNVGAGVKIKLGSLGVRADVRDHITPLKLEELDPRLQELLGVDADKSLHNFELSLGLIIAF